MDWVRTGLIFEAGLYVIMAGGSVPMAGGRVTIAGGSVTIVVAVTVTAMAK